MTTAHDPLAALTSDLEDWAYSEHLSIGTPLNDILRTRVLPLVKAAQDALPIMDSTVGPANRLRAALDALTGEK